METKTVVRCMGRLNVTLTRAVKAMPDAPSAGSVTKICGGAHAVLNIHGFGFEPVTLINGLPVALSADTVILWVTHSGNSASWVSVTRVSPLLQTALRSVFGFNVHRSEDCVAASLKSITMVWSRGTFGCWFEGSVFVM